MEEKSKEYSLFKLWKKWFKYNIECAPLAFIFQLLLIIITAITSGIIMVYNGRLLDEATQYISKKGESKLWIVIGILFAAYAATFLFRILSEYLSNTRNMKIDLMNSKKLIDLIGNVDYLSMQKPDYYKKLDLAKNVIKMNSSADNIISLLRQLIEIGVSIYIIRLSISSIKFLSVIFGSIIMIISMIVSINTTKKQNKTYEDIWEESKYKNHIGDLFNSLSVAKEMFIYDFKEYLLSYFKHCSEDVELKNMKKNISRKLNIAIIRLLPYLASGAFITLLYLYGNINTIGEFSILFSAVTIILENSSLVAFSLGDFYKVAKGYCYYEEFAKFTKKLQTEVTQGEKHSEVLENKLIDAESDITIKDMSFSYDDGQKFILNNISFSVKPGQVVAIVGENGSGKSTLANLISGLYKPQNGSILVKNSNPWCDLNIKKESQIGIIMQNFAKYPALTLKDNVLFGKEIDPNWTEIFKALTWDLPVEGLNKIMGNAYGGCELSGGQWQKLALMRSIIHQKPIIILDEPTAALDPITELQLFNSIVEINHGKTMVIITHRLGSIRNADKILVLKNGSLVEEGSHDRLMSIEGGVYKSMYQTQAAWYNMGVS